jgi:hypothetical protein
MNFGSEIPTGRNRFGETGIDKRITLKWLLKGKMFEDIF